ncbi:MAG: hypothetical protein R2785_05375 [Flavobacteriaceae bacterium]
MQEIDSISFYKKCDARVLGCLEYKTKTLIVNKVYKHHDFGEIGTDEFDKLKSLFNTNLNNAAQDFNAYILHFRDSLFGYKELAIKRLLPKNKKLSSLNPNERNKLLKEAKTRADSRISSHFEHVKSSNKKCKRSLEKFNSIDFYVFNEDINYIEKYGENKIWIKKDSLLGKLFFSKHPQASYLIIKPDGNYFVSNRYISKTNYLQLIKKSDWSKFQKDLELSISKNSRFGEGFFAKKDLIAKNECIIEY